MAMDTHLERDRRQLGTLLDPWLDQLQPYGERG
jgi:hypothetical protein